MKNTAWCWQKKNSLVINRGTGNKLAKLYPLNFWQRRQKIDLENMPTFGAVKFGFLSIGEQKSLVQKSVKMDLKT